MRFFIELSYLGKRFSGWQIQPNAMSVQELIEQGLSAILRSPVRIHGSSRTDAGVHARQQFAHFESKDLTISLKDLQWKLNSFLPKDIAILGIYQVSDQMHARFDATSRKYIYRITATKNPFRLDDVLYIRNLPELDLMNDSAKILLKSRDFQSFSKVKTDVSHFDCAILQAIWIMNGDIAEFHIKANRFLRGMVRAITGSLVDVGFGKISTGDFENIILSKNRNLAGKSMEAHGLTLEEVNYPENYFRLSES
jgi:tRNA pseudouridine38-40 synthase